MADVAATATKEAGKAVKKLSTDLPTTVTKGAEKVIQPSALAVVGGFAGSAVLERSAYQAMRGVFGTNTGPGSLTPSQRNARTMLKASLAILAGGALVTSQNPVVKNLGVGLMAGATWHTLNDFGINV